MYEIYNANKSDTLEIIAAKYGTTKETISEINGFPNDITIEENRQVIVPLEQNKPYKYYTVKKGDNPYQIARDHNIDPDLLLKLNGLDKDDYIYPNQTLLLPKNGLTIYLTKSGDTLSDVLENLNSNIEELLEENPKIYLAKEQILVFKEK